MSQCLLCFWRIILKDVSILGRQFFSFSTLIMSLHCLLASMVFVEKSAVNFIEDPLYVMSRFLLHSWFFVCLCPWIFWLWCLKLWISLSLSYLNSLSSQMCRPMFLTKFYWVWGLLKIHIPFLRFPLSFWGSVHLTSFFFPFCSSDWIILIELSLIQIHWLSVIQIYHWDPLRNLFVIILLNLISIRLFKMISLLLIFSNWWDMVFIL